MCQDVAIPFKRYPFNVVSSTLSCQSCMVGVYYSPCFMELILNTSFIFVEYRIEHINEQAIITCKE
jgi:hypothetical protein